MDLGRLHYIGSWHLRIGYVSWICFFGNLKQVPLEHFAKSDCLRCDVLRFHTFPDNGHWKTNRIIRRPRPLLQSIFANFGDVEDVWAALLSSWAYEGNCPQSNWFVKFETSTRGLYIVMQDSSVFPDSLAVEKTRLICPEDLFRKLAGNLHGICKVWVLPTQKFQCVDFSEWANGLKFCLKAFMCLSLRLAWWTAHRTSTKVGDSFASSLQKAPVQRIHVSRCFPQWGYHFSWVFCYPMYPCYGTFAQWPENSLSMPFVLGCLLCLCQWLSTRALVEGGYHHDCFLVKQDWYRHTWDHTSNMWRCMRVYNYNYIINISICMYTVCIYIYLL